MFKEFKEFISKWLSLSTIRTAQAYIPPFNLPFLLHSLLELSIYMHIARNHWK